MLNFIPSGSSSVFNEPVTKLASSRIASSTVSGLYCPRRFKHNFVATTCLQGKLEPGQIEARLEALLVELSEAERRSVNL